MAPLTNYQDSILAEGKVVRYKPEAHLISDDRIPAEWLNKDGTVLLEIVDPCVCVSMTVYEKEGKPVQKLRTYFDARIVRRGPKSEVVEFLRSSGIVEFHGVEKATIE